MESNNKRIRRISNSNGKKSNDNYDNDENIRRTEKLNYVILEKRFYSLFKSIPINIPKPWLIPFFHLLEDIQLLEYVLNKSFYGNMPVSINNFFLYFHPNITNIFVNCKYIKYYNRNMYYKLLNIILNHILK